MTCISASRVTNIKQIIIRVKLHQIRSRGNKRGNKINFFYSKNIKLKKLKVRNLARRLKKKFDTAVTP